MPIQLRCLLLLVCLLCSTAARALTAADIKQWADDDNDARIDLIQKWVATGDANTIHILQYLDNHELMVTDAGVLVRFKDGVSTDPFTGKPGPDASTANEITVNNRVRSVLEDAIAGAQLSVADADTRLSAARDLQGRADASQLPLIEGRLKLESDARVLRVLNLTRAVLQLQDPAVGVRMAAAQTLGDSRSPEAKAVIEERLRPDGEHDPGVRLALQRSLKAIDHYLFMGELLGNVLTGISLASILLLVALGLAITYGLLGVINMAHGEMLMIGAYTTYVVQNLFAAHFSGAFDYYIIAALPAAFLVSATVGMVLERTVIRRLYGRPLETLLATWGISLFLIQVVRALFGAQNVTVANPGWLSGGLEVMSNVTLPWSRIVIVAFSLLVLASVSLLLTRTRLGLFIRATTQNRTMARCVGVSTWKIDSLAFGLGSGIAGLAGVALSQIGNVGPELGQGYIIDSFLVVVTGGVGQLAGTVYAALGLGVLGKILEAGIGAVLAKIVILIAIILFIQKRPQGLFAFKGRVLD